MINQESTCRWKWLNRLNTTHSTSLDLHRRMDSGHADTGRPRFRRVARRGAEGRPPQSRCGHCEPQWISGVRQSKGLQEDGLSNLSRPEPVVLAETNALESELGDPAEFGRWPKRSSGGVERCARCSAPRSWSTARARRDRSDERSVEWFGVLGGSHVSWVSFGV